MKNQLLTKNDIGSALRYIRKLKGISQEDFSEQSSRTYVSTLERSLKSPTLSKIEELAAVLGIHPLTLLVLSYSDGGESAMRQVLKEVDNIKALKMKL
jgi:transcriptional regulator with XRE-family HTH domain